MACHAVHIRVHVILVLEFLTQGGPIGLAASIACWSPDLWGGATIRIAVAIQAPAHVQRLDGLDDFHLIHPPVALRTAHPCVDMGAVVEVDIIGDVMHFDPGIGMPLV